MDAGTRILPMNDDVAKCFQTIIEERKAPKVEIDYTLRRNLRKKNGGKPGFVIYHTNYSLMAKPDLTGLTRVE